MANEKAVSAFVLPTKPLSIIDAINRMALATGSWANARSGDADYNGHCVEVRWNEYRGYWVAQYQWGDRIVVARGDLSHCLCESKSFYASQGRGASVRVIARNDDDAALCIANNFIAASEEDKSWRDWKFDEVNHALDMERRGFGPYTHHLIEAKSLEDYRARNEACLRHAPIARHINGAGTCVDPGAASGMGHPRAAIAA